MAAVPARLADSTETRRIVLFDGVCGLCSRAVRFILEHDSSETFRFAPLQSESGARLAASSGIDGDAFDTVVLLEATETETTAFLYSDAALRIARRLDGAWRLLGWLEVVPRFVRDPAYRLVARFRYRVFGRFESCWVPSSEFEDRFL